MNEVTKKTILLDLVEKHPESEDIVRQYDQAAGTCMLCHCLFDSIEKIESTYDIDLTQMINELNDKLKIQQSQSL
jgi:hypothetical protein